MVVPHPHHPVPAVDDAVRRYGAVRVAGVVGLGIVPVPPRSHLGDYLLRGHKPRVVRHRLVFRLRQRNIGDCTLFTELNVAAVGSSSHKRSSIGRTSQCDDFLF